MSQTRTIDRLLTFDDHTIVAATHEAFAKSLSALLRAETPANGSESWEQQLGSALLQEWLHGSTVYDMQSNGGMDNAAQTVDQLLHPDDARHRACAAEYFLAEIPYHCADEIGAFTGYLDEENDTVANGFVDAILQGKADFPADGDATAKAVRQDTLLGRVYLLIPERLSEVSAHFSRPAEDLFTFHFDKAQLAELLLAELAHRAHEASHTPDRTGVSITPANSGPVALTERLMRDRMMALSPAERRLLGARLHAAKPIFCKALGYFVEPVLDRLAVLDSKS